MATRPYHFSLSASTLSGNFFRQLGKLGNGDAERLAAVDRRMAGFCQHPSSNALARLPAGQNDRVPVFVHCLDHSLLVVVQFQGDKPLVHVDDFHIVLGKVHWIEHALAYFFKMPIRQPDRNVLPFQERISVERAVGNYGFGNGIGWGCGWNGLCGSLLGISLMHLISLFGFGHSSNPLSLPMHSC